MGKRRRRRRSFAKATMRVVEGATTCCARQRAR
jgi:hypothetical protein